MDSQREVETANEPAGQSTRRYARADLKELVLAAGFEVLLQEGLHIGVDHISYAKVFEHLEATKGIRVTRGSVHERIWANQRDFQLEIAHRAVNWDFETLTIATIEAVGAVIASADVSTHAGRQIAMREAVRVSTQATLANPDAENLRSLWQGITGGFTDSMAQADDLSSIAESIRLSYEGISDDFVALQGQVVEALGWKLRDDLEIGGAELRRLIASIATGLADGLGFRERFTGSSAFELPTGSDGELQRWDHNGYATWMLIQAAYFNPADA